METDLKDYEVCNSKQTIGKTKHILNEYLSKYDIEEVTFFENDMVLYSGSYQEFVQTSVKEIILFNEMKRILESDVEKCIMHNKKKLFLFLRSKKARTF